MNINSQTRTQIKVMLILSFCILVQLISGSVLAQRSFRAKTNFQMGFEGSFGIRSFRLTSNIAAIDNLKVIEEGGSAGLVFGNEVVCGRIRHGYYYSAASVAHTVDLVASEGLFNIYPLRIISKRSGSVQPYFLAGVDRSSAKLYGYYVAREGADPNQKINYSVSQAPYLGKIVTMRASIGAGVEYQLSGDRHFVHIFGEAKYGYPVSSTKSTSTFDKTNVLNQVAINIGVSFGCNR